MNRIKETNRLLAENLVRSIMKDYEACGIAAAIIDKNGVTQYEKFWGVRDLESQKELDGETIFGLASVTKSFTALAIMQMEERGILKLDDPVSRYVPEFTNKNQKTVTIRHLLTHSGGFFPLPRILVDQVAAEMGLDEKEVGDLAYNDALADEGGPPGGRTAGCPDRRKRPERRAGRILELLQRRLWSAFGYHPQARR